VNLPPRITQLFKATPKPVLILVIGGLAVVAAATLKPKPAPITVEKPKPPVVKTWVAQPQTKTLDVFTQGTVAPKREIELVSEVGGRIVHTSTDFVSGGFAQRGSTLIQIDPRDYQFALIQAEASVKDSEQLLATERGRARQAKREWRDLGNPEANALFLREPQLAASEAHLRSAQANRDKAKLNLERCAITLPFDGRIRSTHVNLGQYVTPGTPIAQVFDTQVAQVRLPLTDHQIALLSLPTRHNTLTEGSQAEPAQVTISGTIGGRMHSWQGRLVRTDASIDTRSRLYYAVAEVDSPFTATEEQPTPMVVGLFVEAQIRGRELKNVVRLPKVALFKRNKLYTLTDKQKVEQRQVEVLHSDGKHAWVRGPLPAGTRVIIDKQNRLSEGLSVTQAAIISEPTAPTVEQTAALIKAEG